VADLWEYDEPIPEDPYGGRRKASVESENLGLMLSVWTEDEGGFWASAWVDGKAAGELVDQLVAWRAGLSPDHPASS
jgi:hypothetical protein